jgi:mRNA-degrading endonuclease RelE of RelBE toxin-antitoxin system
VAVHIELFWHAKRDLRRLGPGPDRKALIDALTVGLAAIPPPDNLDIKALKGAAPWLRLRVGDYRILYRPLTLFELRTLEHQRTISTQLEKLRKQGEQRAVEKLMEEVRRSRQQQAEGGFLVARIVHRRDLAQAVRTLPL